MVNELENPIQSEGVELGSPKDVNQERPLTLEEKIINVQSESQHISGMIGKLENSVEHDQASINEIRQRLGLDPVEENPPSIESQQVTLQVLKTKAEKLTGELQTLQTEKEYNELSPQEYLERAQKVGGKYIEMIQRLVRGEPIEGVNVDELSEYEQKFFKNFLDVLPEQQRKQKEMKEARGWGSAEILKQFLEPNQAEILDQNLDKISLQELSAGLYQITIADDLVRKLFSHIDGQAMAVKVKDGISFTIVPDLASVNNPDFKRIFFKENVPHEMNHVASFFVEEAGRMPVTEVNSDVRKAFLVYREELLSHLSTEGGVLGYTHLRNNAKARQELQVRDPETFKEISEKSDKIGKICEVLTFMIGERRPVIDEGVLIMSVMTANNFDELYGHLSKAQENLMTVSIREEEQLGSGWGSV